MLIIDLSRHEEKKDTQIHTIAHIRRWRQNIITEHNNQKQETTKIDIPKIDVLKIDESPDKTNESRQNITLTKGWQKRITTWKNKMGDIIETFSIKAGRSEASAKSIRKARAFITHIGRKQQIT